MNYYDLVQIKDYLKQYKKINRAYRINDNCLCIEFKEKLYFDLTKGKSAIYSGNLYAKDYNSPFDLQLKKMLFNAAILDINVPTNNRILEFKLALVHAYKRLEFYLVLEFSGKFTNALILDDKRNIISALRYGKNNLRDILQNESYIDLEPTKITEKNIKIIDFQEYFANIFNKLQNEKLNSLKAQKILEINKKIEKLQILISSLEDEEILEQKAKYEYAKGDALKENLYKIKDYEREFEIGIYKYNLINSARYELNNIYKNAKKLSQKAKNISIEKDNLNEKIEILQNQLQAIICTKDEVFLRSLFAKQNKKGKSEQNPNVLNFYVNDYKISVGLNENANEYLLKNSKKDDLWFHLKDLKGSHVIISSNKKNYDIDLIYHAASLCACYSGKKDGNFLVDFTKRANVKIIEKAYVNYVNYDTIKVFL